MNFPDRIESLYMLYWQSSYTPSWKNRYTDDLLNFFKYEMPSKYHVNIYQKLGNIKLLNSNRHSPEYLGERTLIEQMRPKKTRLCPLIILNHNFSSYVYVIDSEYMYDLFTEWFGEAMRKQVYGE